MSAECSRLGLARRIASKVGSGQGVLETLMAQVSGLAKSENYDPLAAAPRRHFLPVHMMCDERPNSCRACIGLVCGFRKRNTVPGGLMENYPRRRIALRPQPILLPVVLRDCKILTIYLLCGLMV